MKLNEEQIKFLDDRANGRWTLNEKTGLVDIEGNFYGNEEGLKDFKGIRFGVVTGSFQFQHNKLTSLEGAPQVVKRNFNCFGNKLTSLEGAPQEVGGHFDCSNNKLTSLEGAPQVVKGNFNCFSNKLTSLEGAPQEVGGDFRCSRNNFLIPNCILDLVIQTMKDNGVNYHLALLLNKEDIDKEINKHIEKIEKLKSVFTELDKHIPKDAQKGISMMSRFGHFD